MTLISNCIPKVGPNACVSFMGPMTDREVEQESSYTQWLKQTVFPGERDKRRIMGMKYDSARSKWTVLYSASSPLFEEMLRPLVFKVLADGESPPKNHRQGDVFAFPAFYLRAGQVQDPDIRPGFYYFGPTKVIVAGSESSFWSMDHVMLDFNKWINRFPGWLDAK